MKKKNLKKLVRDRIPNRLIKDGIQFSARGCKDEYEASKLLALKLIEEAEEVLAEVTAEEVHRDLVKAELADVFEVFMALMKHYKINATQLEEQCNLKREKAGGYNDMIFLEWVDADPTLGNC